MNRAGWKEMDSYPEGIQEVTLNVANATWWRRREEEGGRVKESEG